MNETQKIILQREASDRLKALIATLDPAAVAELLLGELLCGIRAGRISATSTLPALFGLSEADADFIGSLLAF